MTHVMMSRLCHDYDVRPSVCLSVCLSVCNVGELRSHGARHCRIVDTTRKGNHSSFVTAQWLMGGALSRLKFALNVTHPFEKRRLRQISAYYVSTIRDSGKVQLWWIRSWPRAFQQEQAI